MRAYTAMMAERQRVSPREIARAEAMEELGLDVYFCEYCRCAMPKRRHQFHPAVCHSCERKHRARRRQWRSRRGTYVDDGHGCVEKVPAWMVDWDGDRGHKRGPSY